MLPIIVDRRPDVTRGGLKTSYRTDVIGIDTVDITAAADHGETPAR